MTDPTLPIPTGPSGPGKSPAARPGLALILSIAAGALLLVVVALGALLIGLNDRGPQVDPLSTGAPIAAPTPTGSEAAEEPVEEEPTEDTTPRFTSFSAPTEVACDFGDEDSQPPKPEIQVAWSSANAVEAWYSPSDEDAKDDNYMQIPLSGDQNDLTDEHLFPCGHDNRLTLTITLVGADGEHVSRSWTVVNVGDQ